MVHPGDRDLIRRFKTTLETGPMAEPWAGGTLHDAMLASDLTDVTSRVYLVCPRAPTPVALRWVRCSTGTSRSPPGATQ